MLSYLTTHVKESPPDHTPAINNIYAIIAIMATILIRQLDDPTKARLRVLAARRGRSMEEEAREILKAALRREEAGPRNLVDSVRRRFARLGGVELPAVRREPLRRPPHFSK